jgi:hypothetical protein
MDVAVIRCAPGPVGVVKIAGHLSIFQGSKAGRQNQKTNEPPVGGSRRTDGWMAATHAARAATKSQQERLAVAQIPHNLQLSCCDPIPSKRSVLCPVRFGHSRHVPASGRSCGSPFENGAAASSRRMLCSIHSLRWRTGSRIRFDLLPLA